MIAGVLGWSESETKKSVKEYEKIVFSQNDALAKTLSESA
jgi:hypothetical protein